MHDHFEFPQRLDLTEFLPSATPNQAEYVLFAVVVHSGMGSGGHYYSFIRPDPRRDDWELCNDQNQVLTAGVKWMTSTGAIFGGRCEEGLWRQEELLCC